ncbi:hypothetical protein HK405_004205 [Cladochytrium tenue]|nr:hypothetical protein HK405_004205 [Cladochytrium tenue]
MDEQRDLDTLLRDLDALLRAEREKSLVCLVSPWQNAFVTNRDEGLRVVLRVVLLARSGELDLADHWHGPNCHWETFAEFDPIVMKFPIEIEVALVRQPPTHKQKAPFPVSITIKSTTLELMDFVAPCPPQFCSPGSHGTLLGLRDHMSCHTFYFEVSNEKKEGFRRILGKLLSSPRQSQARRRRIILTSELARLIVPGRREPVTVVLRRSGEPSSRKAPAVVAESADRQERKTSEPVELLVMSACVESAAAVAMAVGLRLVELAGMRVDRQWAPVVDVEALMTSTAGLVISV